MKSNILFSFMIYPLIKIEIYNYCIQYTQYILYIFTKMDEYICPITHQIFYDPVCASDGNTYEKDTILLWLEKNNTSPLTRKQITKTLHNNNVLKRIIKELIIKNPDLIKDQYIPMFNISIIKDQKYNKILDYKNFYITDDYTSFTDFFENCRDFMILKHFVDYFNNEDGKAKIDDLENTINKKKFVVVYIFKFIL